MAEKILNYIKGDNKRATGIIKRKNIGLDKQQ